MKENDRVVVSDFVNPTQFGENEDLGSYPRDIKRDAALCDAAGVELLFNPSPEEMYYKDNCTFVDMNRLTDVLCGCLLYTSVRFKIFKREPGYCKEKYRK